MIVNLGAPSEGRVGNAKRRNVMVFDGLEIVADDLSNPRWDRVMPIFEEGQIFMCRQMTSLLHRLPKRSLLLDVGVGSGVFAIWAAKHGHPVIGIDVNPRALEIARQNAIHNGIGVCDDPDQLKPGNICLLLRRFDEQFASDENWKQKFECVFLNPPYNPTCPGITPALHAESGRDGQRCFREQIRAVPLVMKRDGVCVGIQMTIKDSLGIQAFREIKDAFSEACSISYANIFDRQSFPVRAFLERQYDTHLRDDAHGISRDVVTRYIDEESVGDPEFAFIYYTVSGHEVAHNRSDPQIVKRVCVPSRTWADRIELHKQIVNFTALPDFAI